MAADILVLCQCPACRNFWRGYRRMVCDGICGECGLRDVEALTWCSNEPDREWDHRLATPDEIEAWMDREVAALRRMGL